MVPFFNIEIRLSIHVVIWNLNCTYSKLGVTNILGDRNNIGKILSANV